MHLSMRLHWLKTSLLLPLYYSINSTDDGNNFINTFRFSILHYLKIYNEMCSNLEYANASFNRLDRPLLSSSFFLVQVLFLAWIKKLGMKIESSFPVAGLPTFLMIIRRKHFFWTFCFSQTSDKVLQETPFYVKKLTVPICWNQFIRFTSMKLSIISIYCAYHSLRKARNDPVQYHSVITWNLYS